jgi:hypothetical protein
VNYPVLPHTATANTTLSVASCQLPDDRCDAEGVPRPDDPFGDRGMARRPAAARSDRHERDRAAAPMRSSFDDRSSHASPSETASPRCRLRTRWVTPDGSATWGRGGVDRADHPSLLIHACTGHLGSVTVSQHERQPQCRHLGHRSSACSVRGVDSRIAVSPRSTLATMLGIWLVVGVPEIASWRAKAIDRLPSSFIGRGGAGSGRRLLHRVPSG